MLEDRGVRMQKMGRACLERGARASGEGSAGVWRGGRARSGKGRSCVNSFSLFHY